MLNVLLIDDDNLEHEFMERLLRDTYKKPYALNYVTTFDAGVDVLKSQKMDVIFLDDNLGQGFDAKNNSRKLQTLSEGTPIIVISNFVDIDHLASSAFLNVYAVIEKNELTEKVERGLLEALTPALTQVVS